MPKLHVSALAFALTLPHLTGCGAAPAVVAPAVPAPDEVAVTLLPLAGDAARAFEEISGLAWRGDELVLLPETLGLGKDPADRHRLAPGPQHVWLLPRAAILDRLDGRTAEPLTPRAVPVTPDLASWRPGEIDGFEAIVVDGDDAWLLVETYRTPAGDNPAWIVRGRFAPDGEALTLDLANARPFPRPTDHKNTSYEALVRDGETLAAFYELNAPPVVAAPQVARFARDLTPLAPGPAPPLAWRLTDAAGPTADGTVWVINYRYPRSDKSGVDPALEPLALRYGRGATHARFGQVERLVALVRAGDGFALADRAPIPLALAGAWEDDRARNWEGIVLLEGRGALLVTDRFPEPATLLGFVPLPGLGN